MNLNLFRDVECGMDVSRMVELGKFDKEFTVYGCAYRHEGETYFAVSEHADTIYRLREKLQLKGVCPSNVMNYHVATSVPAGEIDEIWQDIKWELAKKLMKTYPDSFLDMLNELIDRPAKNIAWPYLQQWQKDLEGRFLKDWLSLFDKLVEECYLAKQLDEKHYQLLYTWSKKIWQQMEDDPVVKDIHHRTLSGFAYSDKRKAIQFKINAQYTQVCRKRQELMNQGYVVTPIYSETFWFQTQTQFPPKQNEFREKLSEMLKPCMELMKKLRKSESFIDKQLFALYYEKVNSLNNKFLQDTFKSYGYQWNCL